MQVFRFSGYWKDVGTIDSLWEANLDLLNPQSQLDLCDPAWKIYSRTPVAPPQYIAPESYVQNSLITEGCEIHGSIEYSILAENVIVEEGAKIEASIIMPGSVIKKGASVQYAIIAENVTVGEGAKIGERPEEYTDRTKWGVAVVGAGLKVEAGAKLPAGEMAKTNIKAGLSNDN